MYQVTSPFWQFVDHWQTLIAGVLAVLAAFATIYFTLMGSKWEVDAAQEQIKTSVEQERARTVAEKVAFLTMLSAAMETVVVDVSASKELFGKTVSNNDFSVEAYLARQRIKKTAFGDIRAALVRIGGDAAGDFLRLDNEIDDFSSGWQEFQGVSGGRFLKGKNLGLIQQLTKIENLALTIRERAKSQLDVPP